MLTFCLCHWLALFLLDQCNKKGESCGNWCLSVDSPLICTCFSHFASQLVPGRNGKCLRRWLPNCKPQGNGGSTTILKHPLRTGECFLLTGHFHWWKWSEKKDAQVERRNVPDPITIYRDQIYSPWYAKQRIQPVSLLPLKIEEKRNASKTMRAFPQIYLLQLGEGGQSKDLSPIEREHWPQWWRTI